jgi:Uma2 family endonuclease
MATTASAKTRLPRSRWHGVCLTEEQYLALPEEKPYLELVDGTVVQKAVPNRDHWRLVNELLRVLMLYVSAQGGECGPEPRVRLRSGRYRVADAAYWAPGRATVDDSIPTLTIEVRSPGEPLDKQREKCRQYREAGVDVAILVDPGSRSVELFDATHDSEVATPTAGAVVETVALPGFQLSLADLFGVLDRP